MASYEFYTGDGVQTDYPAPAYISKDYVKVYLNGTPASIASWPSAGMLRLSPAPADGVVILVQRETPDDAPLVDFEDTNILLAEDLDLAGLQTLHRAEEAADRAERSLKIDDALAHYNVGGKRVTNAADPEDDQDLTTKAWVENASSSPVAAAIAAAATSVAAKDIAVTKAAEANTSATNAAASASSASTASTDAQSAKTAAESARDAAVSAKDQSVAAKDISVTKAGEASASADNAATSETNAAASAAAAATAYDNFDDRYLGAKASAPTTDNDGQPLINGALYFHTAGGTPGMRYWDGSDWQTAYNPSAAGVDSFNGRTGAVSPASSDYDASQIDVTPAGDMTATNVQDALEEKADLVAGKIPTSQLPDSIVGALKWQGTWNANTNSPTIPSAASGNKGWYYKVATAGATNIDGITDWGVGDWIVSNGSTWDKIDNTETVSSVAGKTGAVTLVKGDVGLDNVDNTADTAKPVSSAQQTALDGKEDLGKQRGVNTQTSSYTAVLSDAGKTVELNNASANNFTIPPNSSVAFPVGTYINITQYGAGATTIVAGSGVMIRNRNGLKLGGQYATAGLYKRATDEWVAGGDLKT